MNTTVITIISLYAVPVIFIIILCFGMLKDVKVYDAF